MLNIKLLAILLLLISVKVDAQKTEYQYLLEAEIFVSKDGNFPHIEVDAKTNPTDDKNIIAGALTASRPQGGFNSKIYFSKDGGYTWEDTFIPDQLEYGGADPVLVFDKQGNAYFVSMFTNQLSLYQSEDKGESWYKTAQIPGRGYDHPQIAIDNTAGKHAGNIYVSALYSLDYKLGLMVSKDQGKTFSKPNDFAVGGSGLGTFNSTMLVLSDGTLFIPYVDYNITKDGVRNGANNGVYCLTSNDGGVSFSEPVKIGPRDFTGFEEKRVNFGLPIFALDQSEQFKDRIHMAYVSIHEQTLRLFHTYSDDQGLSWKDPKAVDLSGSANSIQFQPTIAVNKEGYVGIGWYDTRDTDTEYSFRQYFAASVDGGDSFLPPLVVSTEVSKPLGKGNLNYEAFVWGQKDSKMIITTSAFNRYSHGGEYMGLTTDTEGSFIPIWADSRSGTYQIYSRKIQIGNMDKNEVEELNKDLKEENVSEKVEVIVDQMITDAEAKEVSMQVRLKNTSEQDIYGPIVLTIDQWSYPQSETPADQYPIILNAANGEKGVGAIFDYSDKIGSDQVFKAGEISGALIWNFRVKAFKYIWPPISVKIRAQVE